MQDLEPFYNHEYGEAAPMHDPSISPYLTVSEHIFSGLAFALSGVLLPASDVFQHIEPTHDLFHVGIFREPVDNVQSFLFNRLQIMPSLWLWTGVTCWDI